MSTSQQNKEFSPSARSVWTHALRLLEQYQRSPQKTDALLDTLSDRLSTVERKRVQTLFMTAVRHALWIDESLAPWVRRKPKPRLRALLRLACGEFRLREPQERAAVVDFAVEFAKKHCSHPEGAMTNAVLRKVVAGMASPAEKKRPMYVRYSHPRWLVEKWQAVHDLETVRQWLEWNQRPPEIFVRLLGEVSGDLPEGFEQTQWEGFVCVHGESWKQVERLLKAGLAYVQDPSTRLPVALMKPQVGEHILDLCAAPGGKSHMLARAVGKEGRLVCVDLPGRMKRLRENLERTGAQKVDTIECDVLQFAEHAKHVGLPTQYDAVLIDAPCSNTGVLRRRPDAKWRLRKKDIAAMAEVQKKLLKEAARFVKPEGRLVYSTCSVEPEENAEVIQAFLEDQAGAFEVVRELVYFPHDAGHDGGGACLFRANW